MLDAPAERPAAQKERIDLQRVQLDAEQDAAHESVIAKAILDLYDQAVDALAAEHPDLGLRTPDRRGSILN